MTYLVWPLIIGSLITPLMLSGWFLRSTRRFPLWKKWLILTPIAFLATVFLVWLVGCAAGQPSAYVDYFDAPDKSLQAKHTDHVECLALASQSAAGVGAWTSVAPFRAAMADAARDEYLKQCLTSRGWGWYVRPR